MKKHLYLFLAFLFPLVVCSQSVEVNGNLKVSEMDTINSEDHLVVKRPDGTLATRMVASLPSTQDTTRTLQTDLLLTLALCNCPDLPIAMIQSLLENGYSAQDLIDFQISITDLFNAGQTPLDLYNGGVSVDSLYGKTYGGGLIFYLDTLDIHPLFEGLVAAPVDQASNKKWGCKGDSIGGTFNGIGTGQANTDTIVNFCSESGIAAKLCDDLVYATYDDWFLPSLDELNEMYLKLKLNGFGAFPASTYYWSSTEVINNPNRAWDIYFNTGNPNDVSKDFSLGVRAIRAF